MTKFVWILCAKDKSKGRYTRKLNLLDCTKSICTMFSCASHLDYRSDTADFFASFASFGEVLVREVSGWQRLTRRMSRTFPGIELGHQLFALGSSGAVVALRKEDVGINYG